jgi:hypothetical protein
MVPDGGNSTIWSVHSAVLPEVARPSGLVEGLAIFALRMASSRFHRATSGKGMPNTGPRWIKARRSKGLGACVELAPGGEGVLMRNSRRPDDRIHHSMTEFAVFLEAAKNGEFDHLVSAEPAG